jgi:septation ring formation regulator EzrA
MNDSTHELVDCHVRVTPALARRIRKAAFSEQEGRDARSALMIAAECDPDELESLRSQVNKLSDNIDEREQRLVTLKASAENCAADLSKVRKQLGERDDTIAILRKEQEEATARISVLAETLIQSVEVRGLPTDFVDSIRTTIRAVRDGEDPRTAFLIAAKYDRGEVDSALSSVERLTKANVDLERQVAPLNVVLKSGGFKAWVTRRILSV